MRYRTHGRQQDMGVGEADMGFRGPDMGFRAMRGINTIILSSNSDPPGPCEVTRYSLLYKGAKMPQHKVFELWAPVCDWQGLYRKLQRNADTHEWWCVDKKTGVEVEGTRRDMSKRLNC